MAVTTLTDKWVTSLLPVTSIGRVESGERSILLVGSGCLLEAIDLGTSTKLCSIDTLTSQAIKNILPFEYNRHDKHGFRREILVQGGNQIVWIELLTEVSYDSTTSFRFVIVRSIRLKDWVLSGRSNYSEGGATFLTSYNALYHVTANASARTLDYGCLNDELSTFLYSGDVVAINARSYIIASGTAFGEVLIWLCRFDERKQRWIAVPWREYQGHRGSIFGVSISIDFQYHGRPRRIVTSCSDDRTIHIWDASDADFETQELCAAVGTYIRAEAETFPISTTDLAVTWAHASRIWSVDLVASRALTLDQQFLHLISTGEDGTAQSWSLKLDDIFGSQSRSQMPLQNRYVDAHHVGKNIWSRCHVVRGDKTKLYTGGADGQIMARSYCKAGRADFSARQILQAFNNVFASMSEDQIVRRPRQKAPALKSYLVPKSSQLLATTDSGHLVKGFLHDGRISWQLLLTNSKAVPFVLSSQMVSSVAFLVNNSENSLLAYNSISTQAINLCSTRQAKVSSVGIAWSEEHATSKIMSACLAICYFGSTELDLVWVELDGNDCTLISKSLVSLPETFEVSSICYDAEASLLLTGSRAGAMTLYTSVSASATNIVPACCARHIHGSDTMISVRRLDEGRRADENDLFYLTTGRDGTYCVIRVHLPLQKPDHPAVRIDIVHQVTPPLGPNIEGSQVVHLPDGNKKLLLYGFRSTHFIVWDETNQTQVMIVDCGGANRSWTFALDGETGEGGTFVCTKAGTLMLHEQPRPDHQVIRSGGHGREIKALAVHLLGASEVLIATGSEDTDIRLFESSIDDEGERNVRCMSVIRRHTTGLQDLKFSPDGKTLFSAAGMEEMYAWKLSPVPVLRQGIVFAGALPRHDKESDARIMGFDVQELVKDAEVTNYLIVAAFSNGKFKTINYNLASDGSSTGCFTVLKQLDLGTICLTQAHFVDLAARDQKTALVAGTNGFINTCHIQTANPADGAEAQTRCRTVHKIHQNSITAMQTTRLTSSLQLLTTGGDDNALAITFHYPSNNQPSTSRTLIIPNAHAAALTALAVIELPSKHPNEKKYAAITAGNDQRLKTWTINVDLDRIHASLAVDDVMDTVHVDLLEDVYTNVADISEIAVLHDTRQIGTSILGLSDEGLHEMETGREEKTAGVHSVVEVLVVGVGMEVIRLFI